MPPRETPPSLLEGMYDPNDREAWDRFGKLYRTWLLLYCRRLGLQEQDGEEVVQEVLLLVFRKFSAFKHLGPTGCFRSWLMYIAKNKVREYMRKRRSVLDAEADARQQALQDTGGSLEDTWDQEELDRHVLREAYRFLEAELTELERRAFLMHVEKQPLAVIAEQLGISIPTIYRIRDRVLKRLRDYLRGILDESYFS